MSCIPVRAADTRRTETPNATMTTLASPTLGPTAGVSIWRVAMRSGQQGPVHTFDSEQIWTSLGGQLSISVDGTEIVMAPGDTLVVPGGVTRQVAALTDCSMLVAGYGDARVRVPGEEADRGTPAWIV